MCETDARGGVQTILKVHTSIKENLFLCENHERIALITDSETYIVIYVSDQTDYN